MLSLTTRKLPVFLFRKLYILLFFSSFVFPTVFVMVVLKQDNKLYPSFVSSQILTVCFTRLPGRNQVDGSPPAPAVTRRLESSRRRVISVQYHLDSTVDRAYL